MDYSIYKTIREYLDEMFEGTELEDFPTESYVRLQMTLSESLLDGELIEIEISEDDSKPELKVLKFDEEEG